MWKHLNTLSTLLAASWNNNFLFFTCELHWCVLVCEPFLIAQQCCSWVHPVTEDCIYCCCADTLLSLCGQSRRDVSPNVLSWMRMRPQKCCGAKGKGRHVVVRVVLRFRSQGMSYRNVLTDLLNWKCVCVFLCVCELRTAGQRQKDKARWESEGVRLWEAGGEKMSVASHVKVTQSRNVIGSPLSVLAVYHTR